MSNWPEYVPIWEYVSRLWRFVDKPGGVDDDLDQSQRARDGQLRSWADVLGTRAGQCRRSRFLTENASHPVDSNLSTGTPVKNKQHSRKVSFQFSD